MKNDVIIDTWTAQQLALIISSLNDEEKKLLLEKIRELMEDKDKDSYKNIIRKIKELKRYTYDTLNMGNRECEGWTFHIVSDHYLIGGTDIFWFSRPEYYPSFEQIYSKIAISRKAKKDSYVPIHERKYNLIMQEIEDVTEQIKDISAELDKALEPYCNSFEVTNKYGIPVKCLRHLKINDYKFIYSNLVKSMGALRFMETFENAIFALLNLNVSHFDYIEKYSSSIKETLDKLTPEDYEMSLYDMALKRRDLFTYLIYLYDYIPKLCEVYGHNLDKVAEKTHKCIYCHRELPLCKSSTRVRPRTAGIVFEQTGLTIEELYGDEPSYDEKSLSVADKKLSLSLKKRLEEKDIK